MLIKGAMICDANSEYKGDIRIENEKITEVERNILPQENEEIFQAEGMTILPSAIDLNTRIQNFNKENLLKLSSKAALGGIGLATLIPESEDSTNTELAIELLNALKDTFQAQILGLVQNTNKNISTLHKKGAKGIYVKSNENGNSLRMACEFALMLDVPIFFDCEDESLSANGVMNESELSGKLGLSGITELSETKEVAMISELVHFMKIKAVFNAIASTRSIEILQTTKKTHPDIFIQTSIHHLMLTENLCNHYNTLAKIKPPLKSEKTRTKLLNHLKAMEIDLLTSLQSPYSLSQKDLPFDEAAFGIDMIDYFVPMCYTLLVKNSHMSLTELSKILSLNPAQILGLKDYGLIQKGYYANLIVLDTKENQVIDNKESPYYDWIFTGKIKGHFIKGKKIF